MIFELEIIVNYKEFEIQWQDQKMNLDIAIAF
jgi:hypothetical protein